ncbi:hypothetical protein G7Y89_g8671 [Cudoniella acicularis]|uniref:Uncharacterized protein n=1 Tax=Cudoniella acicularis TaxID=354080 RepID=A0A8H4RG53_9HELO|nr:hypothetical protein G7Y89_g8671 [Cudoniella acicularis]
MNPTSKGGPNVGSKQRKDTSLAAQANISLKYPPVLFMIQLTILAITLVPTSTTSPASKDLFTAYRLAQKRGSSNLVSGIAESALQKSSTRPNEVYGTYIIALLYKAILVKYTHTPCLSHSGGSTYAPKGFSRPGRASSSRRPSRRVADVYPDFQQANKTVRAKATIVDLLAHRTGFAGKNCYWH